jgi:phosphate transport system permease protein
LNSTPVNRRIERAGRLRSRLSDPGYHWLLLVVAGVFAALLLAILVALVLQARPAFVHDGLGLVTSSRWDPVHTHYGALPMIVGTLITTGLALLLAVPLGLGTAVALAAYVPRKLRAPLSSLVELLAAVPSVVFGRWGLLVVAPWFAATLEPWLQSTFSLLGIFNGTPIGVGILLAGVILAIMILPTMAAISRDVIVAVPREQREGGYALGGTSWQVVARVMVPSARTGILGAGVLAAGRAMGETIAVTMVIGNTDSVPHTLLGQGQTMASLIANEFTEASEPFHLSSLIAVGLLLLVIAVLVNGGARLMVRSLARSAPGVGVL